MSLIAEYYLRLGKKVYYFDSYGNSTPLNKMLSHRIDLDDDKFVFHKINNLKDLENKTRGIDRNNIIIIDCLSLLYKTQKEKNSFNRLEFLRDYNVFYTSNAYRSISNKTTSTISDINTYHCTNIFSLNIDNNYNFSIKTLKSRTGVFTGDINYYTPLKHIIRKQRIANFLDSL